MISTTQVGAFFDIDGTLLPGPSLEWRFIAYLMRRREIALRNAWRWLTQAAIGFAVRPSAAARGDKSYLRGLRESLIREWEKSLTSDKLPLTPAGISQIEWHLTRGHQVFFVSGTLEPLARVLVRQVGCEIGVRATRLESRRGHWTGAIAGRYMDGDEKLEAVRGLGRKQNLSLAESYAYGNSIEDAPMLGAVGHPTAVKATWRLALVTRRRGWATRSWSAEPRRAKEQPAGGQPSVAFRKAP